MKRRLILAITLILLIWIAIFTSANHIETDIQNYGLEISEGWNLMSRDHFFWSTYGDINDCSSNFKYGYFYDPYQKEYFGGKFRGMEGRNYPGSPSSRNHIYDFEDSTSNDKFAEIYDGKLDYLDAMWVYSSKDCKLESERELLSYSTYYKEFPDFELEDIKAIKLLEGWNFFSIPHSWKDGDSLKNYLGNCDVTRAALWDKDSQKWKIEQENEDVSNILDEIIISPSIRASHYSLLLKVSKTCNLGYTKSIQTPAPELQDNSITHICTDSDGGEKYYIKGFTKGLNAFREGSKATDFCIYYGNYGSSGYGQYLEQGQEAVVEYFCNDKGDVRDDIHICENGCQDGACIE